MKHGSVHRLLAILGLIIAFSAFGLPAHAVVVKMLSIETNTPGEKDYFSSIEKAFEAQHPNIEVQIEYMDDEAFKTKLPTLLQSKRKPHIFFSWGGGSFYEQAEGGVLRDISDWMQGAWEKTLSSAGVDAFTHKGKVYGAPMYAAQVVFWYNRALTAMAGVDPTAIKSWQDFLVAIKALKAHSVTPIVVGGKDKWPLHFYYSYLALRIAGKTGIQDANTGRGDGFNAPEFVKAGAAFKDLVALTPFQPGFMDTTYDKATGLFADGKGAFHLMGNWDYGAQKISATNGKGLADDQLGVINFPAVPNGKGGVADTFGGINGWLVSKGAPDEAVEWLRFMLSPTNQKAGGKGGFWIPVAHNADTEISNPFYRQISKNLAAASYHQLFLDQALGASVGGTVNDVSADLAQDAISPEEAAAQIQEAWEMQ